MPVIIKSLIINGEVGKTETSKGSQNTAGKNLNANQQRILKLEEFTDQMVQMLIDKKER